MDVFKKGCSWIDEMFLKARSTILNRKVSPLFTMTGRLGIMGVLLVMAGCATPGTMSSNVRVDGSIGMANPVPVVHVAKTREARPDGGDSRIGIGLITFIPLVPYGAQRFTPERYYANAAMMTYDFRDDLTQTVIKDLTAAEVAESVECDKNWGGNHKNSGVYRIDLALREGVWKRNFTTYGCSVFGVYFWLFGCPVSYGSADLEFEAVVFAPNGEELGRKLFAAQLPLTEFAYVPHAFPKRLPALYEQISPGFRKFVCDCLMRSPAPVIVGLPAASGPRVRIAVWQLTASAGVNSKIMEALTDSLRDTVSKSQRFQIMARGEMEKVLKEQQISIATTCDTTDCAVEYGKNLSVAKIMVGSVAKVGNTYQITIKIVDVATAAEECSGKARASGGEEVLLDLVDKAATELIGR